MRSCLLCAVVVCWASILSCSLAAADAVEAFPAEKNGHLQLPAEIWDRLATGHDDRRWSMDKSSDMDTETDTDTDMETDDTVVVAANVTSDTDLEGEEDTMAQVVEASFPGNASVSIFQTGSSGGNKHAATTKQGSTFEFVIVVVITGLTPSEASTVYDNLDSVSEVQQVVDSAGLSFTITVDSVSVGTTELNSPSTTEETFQVELEFSHFGTENLWMVPFALVDEGCLPAGDVEMELEEGLNIPDDDDQGDNMDMGMGGGGMGGMGMKRGSSDDDDEEAGREHSHSASKMGMDDMDMNDMDMNDMDMNDMDMNDMDMGADDDDNLEPGEVTLTLSFSTATLQACEDLFNTTQGLSAFNSTLLSGFGANVGLGQVAVASSYVDSSSTPATPGTGNDDTTPTTSSGPASSDTDDDSATKFNVAAGAAVVIGGVFAVAVAAGAASKLSRANRSRVQQSFLLEEQQPPAVAGRDQASRIQIADSNVAASVL